MKLSNFKLLKLLFIVIIIIYPFWHHNSSDEIKAQNIDSYNLGYYQSSTCEISLLEVYFKNIGNKNNITYSNNFQVGAECFGKVTGLDKNGDKFIVSIGTNTSLLFLIQSILWLTLISLIKPKKIQEIKLNGFLFFLPFLFSFQLVSEERFYSNLNLYYTKLDSNIFGNYYFLGIVTIYLFIFLLLDDLLSKRESNIINYLPYSFLFIFTFGGMNVNFYLCIISYFGLKNLVKYRGEKKFNILFGTYFILLILFSNRETGSFFDTDKLRGFVNSSNNLQSLIFWLLVFFLLIHGFKYLYKNSQINLSNIQFNFLLTGSFTVWLGVIASVSPFFNFYIFNIFGQNKNSINKLSSIAGNTWRGYSPSAETIGEFYAFVILFFIITSFYLRKKPSNFEILMILINAFGLYRSNNFAAFSSLIFLIFIFIIENYVKSRKTKNLVYFLILILIFSALIYIIEALNYEYLSTQLLYEASLQSNFFSYTDNYGKSLEIEKYFNEKMIYFLINFQGGDDVSTALRTLSKIFYQNFNIPLMPNLVALISLVSVLINRSEMWGIFIAKYSPNVFEALFGHGPNQLNRYLFTQEVRLDLPPEKLTVLWLPHSSVSDLLVFFGIFGTSIIFYFLFKLIIKRSEMANYKFLVIFLIINLLKSDSILYLNSTILFFISINLLRDKEFTQ